MEIPTREPMIAEKDSQHQGLCQKEGKWCVISSLDPSSQSMASGCPQGWFVSI